MKSQFVPRPALAPGRYRIADLVDRYGTSLRTLRYYEQSGLVRPDRPNHHTRFYSEEDVARLDFIFDCRQTGMTIRNIKELLKRRDTLSDREFGMVYASALRKRMAELLEEMEDLERQKQLLQQDLAYLDGEAAE